MAKPAEVTLGNIALNRLSFVIGQGANYFNQVTPLVPDNLQFSVC